MLCNALQDLQLCLPHQGRLQDRPGAPVIEKAARTLSVGPDTLKKMGVRGRMQFESNGWEPLHMKVHCL